MIDKTTKNYHPRADDPLPMASQNNQNKTPLARARRQSRLKNVGIW